MSRAVRSLIAIALLAALPVQAAEDAEAGHAKSAACIGCHGADGVSRMPGVPSLAGQQDQFLQWQLVFFRSGRRPNPIMGPLSANLDDQDVRDIGAYFASLPKPPTPTPATDEARRAQGQAIVEQHHCSNCHMEDFQGKRAAAAIGRQREDYLAKALADYRSASRPSTGVAAMTEAASGLSDDDIAAIATYLASL